MNDESDPVPGLSHVANPLAHASRLLHLGLLFLRDFAFILHPLIRSTDESPWRGPARAGSVGLPNKHLLPLLGRPVISYTLDHAAGAARLSRVVVSSDCPLVRRFGVVAGFDAVIRPAALATSEASVQDVMLHALDAVEAADGTFKADALVVLYGNVPVRPAGAIDRAIELLERTGCDSVRSFCPVGKWHPAWMSRLSG